MCNYNLFRRVDRAELICAVPEVWPVPAFIAAPGWEFVGPVRDCTRGSPRFNHREAEEGIHFNGFYLFQVLNAPDLGSWADRDPVQHREDEVPARGIGRQWQASGLRMSVGSDEVAP